MREQLKDHIKAVLEGIRHLDVDSAGDLILEVRDEIATEDRAGDAINNAILDGIRWGYHAAVTVELGGGAMLRVILPGGIAMTYEWADEALAQPQIEAALDALHGARVIAQGVGDDHD